MLKKVNTKSTKKDILLAYAELNTLYQGLEKKLADLPASLPLPKRTKPEKVNIECTRQELIEAYEELNTLYQELENKLTKVSVPAPIPKRVEPTKPVQKPIQTTETAPEKSPFRPPNLGRETVVEKGNIQAHMEAVIATLNEMGEKFNAALSQLSTSLLVEATRLKEVCTQVDEENQRLAKLYGLKIEEDTLDHLLEQYADTEKAYEETLTQRQETVEKAFTEKSQTWQQEKEDTEQQLREQQASEKKEQEREKTEYHYTMQLQRGMSDEEYAEQRKQQQQTLKTLTEERQKAWAEQEKALSEREQQFKEFKEKVEQFPKELETAIKKAKEEGAGIARHQAKIKADFVTKEVAGEEEIHYLRITNLESEVAKQSAQIDKLSKQLEAAFEQTQELAVRAIEGASSHTSFQALKEITLEQAKNQSKAK
jgi:hypothetical protein